MTLNEDAVCELLDQATPGPWVTVGECFIDKDGNERYSPELISSRADGIGRDVMWNTDEAVSWCSNLHDPQLAALAPELARDWLRMRNDLVHLARILEVFADGPDATPADKFAAQQIHQILNWEISND